MHSHPSTARHALRASTPALAAALRAPIAALLLLTAALLAAADAPPLLDRMDVFELEYADAPQVSPFGDAVVYVRRSLDVMKDRTVGTLWTIDVESGTHLPLVTNEGSVGSPRWSPDGTRLAFVGSGEGGAEIRVRWLESGRTATIATPESGPRSLTWSPDGKHLAFVMSVPTSLKPLAAPPSPPAGAKWGEPAKVIEHVYYRADGAGFVAPAFDHIFIVPADGGTPRQVTSGDFNHGGAIDFSADGKTILFSANRREDWEMNPQESEIWSVSLSDGELVQLTGDRVGPDAAPVVSPDGRHIAYVGYDDKKLSTQQARLYVMNADGSGARELTGRLDHSVGNVQWGDDGNIWFQFDDHGQTRIARVNTRGRDFTLVANGLGGTTLGRPYTSGTYSVSAGTVAYTTSTPQRPADITILRGEEERQVTALNDDLLGHRRLGRVEEMLWESSADGLEIEGWLAFPANYERGKRYPLILEIHGGPHAAYGPVFSAEVQLYAAAGYFVLYANPRGSTSYGQAFAQEIHHNYPSQDYDDLMSGVDAVLARGDVDPEQLYVTGGSGGGVLTAWIVGKTDRFRAAVVAKPVINWTSFTLTADGYPYFTRYWFADMPWENPESYWKRSPLSLVGNVSTPTMLLTGESDYRTPISESEQYYQALKLRGVPSAMVRIPGASHGIARRPSNLIAKVDNILAWFARYAPENDAE
jgi:dipeptidyl aminopeptidase/acylaminoacyl peptidase